MGWDGLEVGRGRPHTAPCRAGRHGPPVLPSVPVPALVADDLAAFRAAIADRYTLLHEVGRGGMAVVYRARDERHQRDVALKVLPPDTADAVARARFAREIAVAAGLTHPNILALHDSGEAAGRRYFSMPFVEGPTLRTRLREHGPLDPAAAVALARELADALAHAHAHGIVHRDLKPENVLLVAGHAVLADFGIARRADAAGDATLTTVDGVVGTRAYMSPEQATPGAEVDGRSDVYALGLVLLETLTGAPSTLLPTLAAALAAGASTPRARGVADPLARVPRALHAALARAVAPAPADRHPDAAAFAEALRVAARQLEADARRAATRPTRALAWSAVALLAASAGGLWLRGRVAAPPAVPVAPRPTAAASTADAVPLAPRRVVVAPLGDAEGDRVLGTMAADWITEGLQGTGLVEVVPTVTALQAWAFARRAGGDPVRALAHETGAAIVVTGSTYARPGGRVALQVQVSDAARSRLIGAVGPLEGPLADPTPVLQAARTRVMGLLARTLDARLAAAPTLGGRPPTFEAYRAFSEGLQGYVTNDFAAAAERFVAAWRRDPSFATALLMASIARSNEGRYAEADALLARLAPQRDALDDADRLWFDYRRSLLAGRRADALAAVRRLAAATPGTKATYNWAVEAMQNGRLGEAAVALDALPGDRGPMRGWAPYWDVRARVHHMAGDRARERRDADAARARFPTRRFALAATVRLLAVEGRTAELRRTLAAARALPPDPFGTTASELALEAGTELRAHGHAADATAVLLDGLAWATEAAARAPSADAAAPERAARAALLHALGRARAAADSAGALAAAPRASDDRLGLAAAAAIRAGDASVAARWEARLAARPARYGMGRAAWHRARLAALRDRPDEAVALLRRAFAEGLECDLWVHRDPDFAALRGRPDFDELARGCAR